MAHELLKSIEIIPSLYNKDRLYWFTAFSPPQSTTGAFYFDVSKVFTYKPLAQDFGPYDIGQIHTFCNNLKQVLDVILTKGS